MLLMRYLLILATFMVQHVFQAKIPANMTFKDLVRMKVIAATFKRVSLYPDDAK